VVEEAHGCGGEGGEFAELVFGGEVEFVDRGAYRGEEEIGFWLAADLESGDGVGGG
jgi:hypothetical protein